MNKWTAALLGALIAPCHATVILDFDDAPLGNQIVYEEDGFRFTALSFTQFSGHLLFTKACDPFPCPPDNTSTFLGWWNFFQINPPQFLLEPTAGGTFDLLGLDPMAPVSPAILTSSKGGTLVIPGFPITSFDLFGPEWEDLDFITFSVPGPRGETWGIDNIRLGVASVPEPPTLALIAAGALVFSLSRRRRRI